MHLEIRDSQPQAASLPGHAAAGLGGAWLQCLAVRENGTTRIAPAPSRNGAPCLRDAPARQEGAR